MPPGAGLGPVTGVDRVAMQSGPDGALVRDGSGLVPMQGPGGMYLWYPPFVGAGAVECGAHRPEQGRNMKAEQPMEGGEQSWGFACPHHGASQYREGGANVGVKRGYEDSLGGAWNGYQGRDGMDGGDIGSGMARLQNGVPTSWELEGSSKQSLNVPHSDLELSLGVRNSG